MIIVFSLIHSMTCLVFSGYGALSVGASRGSAKLLAANGFMLARISSSVASWQALSFLKRPYTLNQFLRDLFDVQ